MPLKCTLDLTRGQVPHSASEDISHGFEADRGENESTHRTVLSSEPDTPVLPSGLMATLHTVLVCPSNVDVKVGQFGSFVSSLACGLGSTPAACLATRLLVGASTAS